MNLVNMRSDFQHITASICGGIYARVDVYDVVVKKVLVRYLIS